MSEISSELSMFSPRDLQLYASKLLQTYCTAKSFQHCAINNLIAHLNNYPETHNQNEWEKIGALLPLNGRGDDMPSDLTQSIPPQDIDDFCQIVDSAVEVGIVDLYGAPTDLPAKFIEKMSLIFSKNKIDISQL
ncbi:hypothetical protein PS684_05678 [Pseudomonas fluorescens]|nr:hypothetical protein PS681_05545 [Pseudomonas fluorescens]VVN69468.1 hypothetical protein PS684_05678 [Pseudomonas fluorescens]